MDREYVISERNLMYIADTYCSCGGRGPDDDPCDACAFYHEVKRLADNREEVEVER